MHTDQRSSNEHMRQFRQEGAGSIMTIAAGQEHGLQQPAPFSCRFCGKPLRRTFVDLGMSPLCETYIEPDRLHRMEPFFPLHVYLCDACFLVQLPTHVAAEEIFGGDYAYFSSYSDSWLRHARDYVDMITLRLGLNGDSLVVEVACNDGYLLQYFVPKGIPTLGIEPARNVAAAARQKGVPCITEFFGRELARRLTDEGRWADLILGNNVLAHVPDINDFVAGMKILLKPGGVITIEFPHLLQLVDGNQFDTIYHEHFSYLSFTTVERIFAAHGLILFDVEELSTHGGSLRIYAQHAEQRDREICATVTELKAREQAWGVWTMDPYIAFEENVRATKRRLLRFLIEAKAAGKSIAGYGAPGKGNTLLNYCGVRTDFIDYTVDRNPYKQGKYTPGTHIPILEPERIRETRPDFLLILPWNLKEEIVAQNAFIRDWGGKFVVPIPELAIYD